MLIVTGTYKAKPGTRDDFLKAIYAQGILDAFLKEEGNISYDYYLPYGSDDDIFFVERWENGDSWEVHKTSPNTKRLQPIKDEFMAGFIPGFVGELVGS